MITILDYGMGNLRSVQKAFERINVNTKITIDPNEAKYWEKILLPGVGHFENGIKNLKKKGFYEVLNELVLNKKLPILGICLGMQLMTEFSEEGNCKGFGWIKGNTRKFKFQTNELKIPHIGWNNLNIKKNNDLFKKINNENFFYFVHSYSVSCKNSKDILTETIYGDRFVSSFNKDNIYGVQFHPEKSHDAGLQVLRNFAEL